MTDRQVLLPPRPAAPDPLGRCPVCKLKPRAQEWFTVRMVARHFGRSIWTFRRLIKAGELAALRLPGGLNVSHESLDEWVERHSTTNED
jgi:hypothetical protein